MKAYLVMGSTIVLVEGGDPVITNDRVVGVFANLPDAKKAAKNEIGGIVVCKDLRA